MPTASKMIAATASLFLAAGAQVQVKPNDPNLYYDGVWYPKATADSAVLQRYSDECMANANCAPTWAVNVGIPQQQPGVVIRFRTASPGIVVKMRESDATPMANRRWPYQQYGVYKDGIWAGTVTAPDRVAGRATVRGDGAEHSWEVLLPHQMALTFLGLELDAGQSLKPMPKPEKPVYVALGDSKTHGEGQTGAYEGYAWKVARAKGWELINLATGGTTANPEMASLNFPGKKIDVVSIEWGFNEWLSEYFTLEPSKDNYANLLEEIRAAAPKARIYCILPTFTLQTQGKPAGEATLDEYRAAYKSLVAARVAGGDKNIFVIEGQTLTTAADVQPMPDGVHLTAKGAGHLADGLIPLMSLDGQAGLATPGGGRAAPMGPGIGFLAAPWGPEYPAGYPAWRPDGRRIEPPLRIRATR